MIHSSEIFQHYQLQKLLSLRNRVYAAQPVFYSTFIKTIFKFRTENFHRVRSITAPLQVFLTIPFKKTF